MNRAVIRLGCLLIACSCATPARAAPEQSGPHPGCDIEPLADCRISDLPRLSEGNWPAGELESFLARTKEGIVAIDWQANQAKVVAGCRLDGRYTEVTGEPGSGRLWANDRALFRIDEVPASCLSATHVVVSYVVNPQKPKANASRAIRFAALLVPLPCPSVLENKPARGCIGRGLDGPARREQAQKLLAGVRVVTIQKKDPVQLLTAHALAPDDVFCLNWVKHISTECSLTEHVRWSVEQYSIGVWDGRDRKATASLAAKGYTPRLRMGGSDQSCLARPAFLECFPGAFDPAPAGGACWQTSEPGRQ